MSEWIQNLSPYLEHMVLTTTVVIFHVPEMNSLACAFFLWIQSVPGPKPVVCLFLSEWLPKTRWQSVAISLTTKGAHLLGDLGTVESTRFLEWKLPMGRIPIQWVSLAFSIEQLALVWVERLPAMSWEEEVNVGFYVLQENKYFVFPAL